MPILTPEKFRELEEIYANIPEQIVPEVRDITSINLKPLSAYPLPAYNTRRGMHGTAEVDRPFGSNPQAILDRLKLAGFCAITILINPGGDNLGIVDYALSIGFSVSIRMYRPRPNPHPLTGEQKATLQRVASKYRGKPVYWITNNEPDLPDEWEDNRLPNNWLQIVARNAIADARFIQGLGLIPVLPAAATGSPGFYQYRLIPMIVAEGGADIFNGLIIFGVHNYCIGHPIGGIAYENLPYPYDDVNQMGRALTEAEFRAYGDVWRAWETDNMANVSGERARNKNPNQTHLDLGGASGWIAIFHQWEINVKAAGLVGLPVISTEGGEWFDVRNDGRYPRTNPDLRSARMLEIAKRAANRSVLSQYNFPDWYLGENGDWLLEDDRAHSPWNGGGYFSFGQLRPEYANYMNEHAQIVRNIQIGTPTPPPPDPPPPSTLPPRVLVDMPDFVSIQDAQANPGEKFWRIVRAERKRGAQNNDLHHIFHVQPHNAQVTMIIKRKSVGDTLRIPHDKPANEPAANFPMNGQGNKYDASVDGLGMVKSDKLIDAQMFQNQHESFHLTWELVTMPAQADPAQKVVKDAGDLAQVLSLNPNAAIQKKIFAKGYVPTSPEYTVKIDWQGQTQVPFVFQRAERLDTGKVMYFGCKSGAWNIVYWTDGIIPLEVVP